LNEKRKQASNTSGESDEAGTPVRAAAVSSRRNKKQRGASAAAASTAGSDRSQSNSKLHTHRGGRRNKAEKGSRKQESSQDESSSSDDEDVTEEADNDSALSDLSDAEVDEPMDSLELPLSDDSADDLDAGDEWKPGATAPPSYATGRRCRSKVSSSSLLKIRPLMAVKRFIVDALDSANPSSYGQPHILEALLETMDVRKSVTELFQLRAVCSQPFDSHLVAHACIFLKSVPCSECSVKAQWLDVVAARCQGECDVGIQRRTQVDTEVAQSRA
jgi:hypothetical protein